MKGWAPSLDLMLRYRVLLAPLRYGAGLKGKVRASQIGGRCSPPLARCMLPAVLLHRAAGVVKDAQINNQEQCAMHLGRRWSTHGGTACRL